MRPMERLETAAAAHIPTRREGLPGVGDLLEMRRDPLGYLARVAPLGDVVRLRFGRSVYLLNHPDHARRVLHENHVNYRKSFFYARMKPLVGEGLLTSEGGDWKRKRRLAQPAFHRERLAGFVAIMSRHTAAMLDRWAGAAARGEPLDVAAEMMKLTLTVVGHALFGQDMLGEADRAGRALTTALRITNERFFALVYLPPWLPTPANLRFAAAMRVLDTLVTEIVAARRGGAPRDDLLGMLMEAREAEGGGGLTDAELRDEVMTMVLAGHETTANALTWAFHLLAGAPRVDGALAEESSRAVGGREVALEDLPRLDLASRVHQEAMRLFPPAWIFGREALAPDRFGEYALPAGAAVSISPYLLHRDPRFWEAPERFDPDRFLPAMVAGRHRYAYLPFAAGPRMCIGNAFATMEMQVVLAMVASRYRLTPVPGRPVELDPSVTLRPRRGLWMNVVPRAS
ncbi:MAG TPA: cytochrome P450 [Anaeromyxobacter sp.]|nr:cytochrome P450 [Anaeromyxobacter sp.]